MTGYTDEETSGEEINPDDYLENFSLPGLYPYQRAIIDEICVACGCRPVNTGKDAPARGLILLPTGAGKSICYMLPSLIIPGYSLIIYPLNALISDQLKRFSKAGISARSLAGGIKKAAKISSIAEAASGKVRVLLANPESLLDTEIQTALAENPPLHAVFDEAHTSAEWGYSFRPAYLRVCSFIRNLAPARISAFTATASPELLPQMAELIFGDQGYSLHSRSPAKDNIAFGAVPSICREADILRLVENCLTPPMIIFCRRRRDAENTARLLACRLNDEGNEKVRFYHAGLSNEEKQQVERWFMKGGNLILCATCAFGLGVDCPGVRSVVHLAPPPSVEAYVQESGRAGRDGKPCRALMLFGPEDLADEGELLRNRRYRDLVSAFLSNKRCRRKSLMDLFSTDDSHPACGICDVCTGSEQLTPHGFQEITGLVKEFPFMFRSGDVSDLLKGYRSVNPGGAGRKSRFVGTLRDWDYNWCQEAVQCLVSCGTLRRKRFSGRLTTGSAKRLYGEKTRHS